jgi:hypothetical protein
MSEKISFIKLPLILVLIYFIGRLVVGASGGTLETANSVFSMVILQVHIALLWGAVARRFMNYRLGETLIAIVMIIFFSQILIWGATAISDLAGIQTFFNDPRAVARVETPLSFSENMVQRAIGLVVNCIIGAVIGSIGYALGGLIPASLLRRNAAAD